MNNDNHPHVTLGSFDVLMGRGGASNKFSGNIVFRCLVAKQRQAYQQANHVVKTAIRDQIMATVAESGGRFVWETKQRDGTVVYMPVCDKLIQRKVSQALRERIYRTPKSTSKAKCIARTKRPVTKNVQPDDAPSKPFHNRVTRAAVRASQELRTRRSHSNAKPKGERLRHPTNALPHKQHKIRDIEHHHRHPIDLMDLVSMPLVPSPPQMWDTPPMPMQTDPSSVCWAHNDAFRKLDTFDAPPHIPMERTSRATEDDRGATPQRSNSSKAMSKHWKTSVPTVRQLSAAPRRCSSKFPPTFKEFDPVLQDLPVSSKEVAFRTNNQGWKTMTNPQDSLEDIEPNTTRLSPNSNGRRQSPHFNLSDDESSTVVDDQGSQHTTSTNPSFHLIRPKEPFTTSWTSTGHSSRAPPTLHPVAEMMINTVMDQGTIMVPPLAVHGSPRSRDNAKVNMVPESLKKSSLALDFKTTTFFPPTSAMEKLSIREESPDPMTMFASNAPPSDDPTIYMSDTYPSDESPAPKTIFVSNIPTSEDQTSREIDSYPAKIAATSPPYFSSTVYVPIPTSLKQGNQTPSPLVASARLSSGTIPPHRMSKRDHDFIDATLHEAKASRILEFDDSSRFGLTSAKRLKSCAESSNAADYAPFHELQPFFSRTIKLESDVLDSNEAGYRVRRVSDVKGSCNNDEAEPENPTQRDDLAMPSPTRRVSL